MPKICNNCGTANRDSAVTCKKCGTVLSGSNNTNMINTVNVPTPNNNIKPTSTVSPANHTSTTSTTIPVNNTATTSSVKPTNVKPTNNSKTVYTTNSQPTNIIKSSNTYTTNNKTKTSNDNMKYLYIGLAAFACVIIAIVVLKVAFGNKLIGTWETSYNRKTYQFVFDKNGKGSITRIDEFGIEKRKTIITWETDGDELFIKEVNDDDISKYYFKFKNNELILIKDGHDEEIVFVKID